MGYVYACDAAIACEGEVEHDDRPMVTGEFNEHLYDNTPLGDRLRQAGYEPGGLVTICPDCVAALLLD